MKVTFDHKIEIAKNIYSFYFRPETRLRYVAGQFIELFIPHENPDERGIKHWFTLSSSPSEDLLAITTKLNPDRSSSFKASLSALKSGCELTIHPPMGDFVLPKDPSIPLLFVAGGIGCTPYRSMIKYLQDSHKERTIRLLYVATSEPETAFKDVFDKLGDNFVPIIGNRLTSRKILGYSTSKHYIYLSGPELMVEILDKELRESGVNPTHLRTDFFPNYTSI